MPSAIKLFDGLQKGITKTLTLTDGSITKVPDGRKWLILSASISHITGTDTILKHIPHEVTNAVAALAAAPYLQRVVASASASEIYPVFTTTTENPQPPTFWIVEPRECLYFDGDASAICILKILEWFA